MSRWSFTLSSGLYLASNLVPRFQDCYWFKTATEVDPRWIHLTRWAGWRLSQVFSMVYTYGIANRTACRARCHTVEVATPSFENHVHVQIFYSVSGLHLASNLVPRLLLRWIHAGFILLVGLDGVCRKCFRWSTPMALLIELHAAPDVIQLRLLLPASRTTSARK
ncbi:hypothetical protein BCR33DRAFT_734338 [Rhizoclosmatium globosum]|uniref:Uncharacterized protein n=1 Tax=Rhizoclosmatium globosum TaxID=329046 RepID=A0A1Y2CTK5_9FUNG|nr:hypothetical protein BCR33DRAFT_839140 [Rhizoclosmatium globosum]ORY50353.1 hypothetical protein BCR33DRAFT_734338 [Rhizoclosmatium globosum]|eukprot:ORY50352.1 hypothetical protein BCR33DRAFT_839140 [Rhizoclosmatium globosum]